VRDRTGVSSLQAAAGACTCAYVPAIWLKEMASLLLPAKKLPVAPLSGSHRHRLDKPAKWLLRRPGAASPSCHPPKTETGAAAAGPLKRMATWRAGGGAGAWHFDKPWRRALTSAAHPVWSALVFPRLDF
ncbi:hypothetical protein PVAP13_9KG488626, partial [Panicum virgatum]